MAGALTGSAGQKSGNLCGATFLTERISRLLGVIGNIVLTRMFGLVPAAMAVQFVIDEDRGIDK